MFFLALLAVTASLLLLSVCFIAVWSATSRPSVTLDQSEVTVKAGETFSKDQVGYTILHARTGDLTIDDSRVDLKRAGDYTVRYQLRKSALEKLVEHFSPNPSVEEPSAGYIFTWDMLGNGSWMTTDAFEGEPGTHSEFVEGLMATGMKKTCDDLAIYLSGCVQ